MRWQCAPLCSIATMYEISRSAFVCPTLCYRSASRAPALSLTVGHSLQDTQNVLCNDVNIFLQQQRLRTPKHALSVSSCLQVSPRPINPCLLGLRVIMHARVAACN
jgi:hypothetical protein